MKPIASNSCSLLSYLKQILHFHLVQFLHLMIMAMHPFSRRRLPALSIFCLLVFLLSPLSICATALVDGRNVMDEAHTKQFYISNKASSTRIAAQPSNPRIASSIPALPVEWQANSCELDLNDQLLGGVEEACQGIQIDERRCCPVLAAWLMAARAKVALQSQAPAAEGMPLLPDDSMVCVANMKAALESRGLHLTAPNASCDVVMCFCGIRLNEITIAECPIASQNTSSSQSSINVSSTLPSQLSTPLINGTSASPEGSPQPDNDNGTLIFPSTGALEANCTNHSYTGCTKCLATLQLVTGVTSTKSKLTKAEQLDCQLIGLMALLATNKTLYIPTVSAVLRALRYTPHSRHDPKCSPDWANMPLALDTSEVQQRSLAQPLISPTSWSWIGHCLCFVSSILLSIQFTLP
eukprot:c39090_g1_i1 orf=460-1689(-)